MTVRSSALGLALATMITPPLALAGVDVGVFIDKSFVEPGGPESTLSISGFNDGPATPVDVHFGLIAPDGTVYEYPDWNTALRPWLPSFTMPANLRFPATPIAHPEQVPGGLKPGTWYVAAALTRPGTFDFLAVDLQPFTVVDPNRAVVNGTRYGALTLSVFTGGVRDVATAAAFFFGVGRSGALDQLVGAIGGQEPALESCEYHEQTIDFSDIGPIDGLLPRMLDAGAELTLSGGGQTLTLPRDSRALAGIDTVFYKASPTADFYRADVEYRFHGDGGSDIGPFTAKAKAPAPLQLSAPDPSGVVTHTANADLALAWNGNRGRGEVEAALMSVALGSPGKVFSIDCRFVDDGSGVIPGELIARVKAGIDANGGDLSSLLSSLGSGGSIGGIDLGSLDLSSLGIDLSSIDLSSLDLSSLDLSSFGLSGGLSPVILTIGRHVIEPFDTDSGELSAGFFAISSGASVSITLQ